MTSAPPGPVLSFSGRGGPGRSFPFRGRGGRSFPFRGRGFAGRVGNKSWTKPDASSGNATLATASAFTQAPVMSSPPPVAPVLTAPPQEVCRPQASQLLSAWRLAAADAAAAAAAASSAAAAAALATRAASKAAAAASQGSSSSADAVQRAPPFVTRAGNLQWKGPDAVAAAASASSQQRSSSSSAAPQPAATIASRSYQQQHRQRSSWQATGRGGPWWATNDRRAVVPMRAAPRSSLKWVRGATTTNGVSSSSSGPLLHHATGKPLYGNKRILRPRSIARTDPQHVAVVAATATTHGSGAVLPVVVAGALPGTSSRASAAATASAAAAAAAWRQGQKVYLRTASGMSLRRVPSAGSAPPPRPHAPAAAAAAGRQKFFGNRVLLRAKHAEGAAGSSDGNGSGSTLDRLREKVDGDGRGGSADSASAVGKRKRGAATASGRDLAGAAGLTSAKTAVARARLLLTRNKTLRPGSNNGASGSRSSSSESSAISKGTGSKLAFKGEGKAKAGKAPPGAKEELCLFFNRFGVCNRGDKCCYIHDRSKVAVCLKFLKGECREEACPLTHEIQSEKMPVCSFFLRGLCVRENCPYRHVKVAADAAVCTDFLKGYCPRGLECRLKHELPGPKHGKKRGRGGDDSWPQGTDEGAGRGGTAADLTVRTGEQSRLRGSGAAAQGAGSDWVAAAAAEEDEEIDGKRQRIAAVMEEDDGEDESVLPSFARKKRPSPA